MSATAVPYTPAAYKLLHDGAVALAEVSANGIKIDTKYLERAIETTDTKIRELERSIANSEVAQTWKKRFRHRTNLDSNDQLAEILFNVMKFKCEKRTQSGKPATDEKSLSMIEHPFVQDYLEIKKYKKARGTSLKGIARETVGHLLHPSFNLNFAVTFRSSSSDPNFQNFPVRIEWLMKLIRSCFVARRGRRLVEVDFKGVEVCTAACYHEDPNMIRYIENEDLDMHRDMALEIYQLEDVDHVSKKARYCAKNKFVFPEFYGSYWAQCAPELWYAIKQMKLENGDGLGLREHLRAKGIKKLGSCGHGERPEPGTFAEHVMMIERSFWQDRFAVYAQWKKDWYEKYLKRGWIKSKTGFICQGFMKRNDVINYPVQGSAFHCLLWALIEIQRELHARGMKALIVGQIHDSILADVPDDEVNAFLEICHEVMTQRIREHYRWIIVPFSIDVDVTPIGGNWTEKAPWERTSGGLWVPRGEHKKVERPPGFHLGGEDDAKRQRFGKGKRK